MDTRIDDLRPVANSHDETCTCDLCEKFYALVEQECRKRIDLYCLRHFGETATAIKAARKVA